jgi:hypothetical protein
LGANFAPESEIWGKIALEFMMTSTTDISTDTSVESQETAAPETLAEDPSQIGSLTPEEQAAMTTIRTESQQLLAKAGELDFRKQRVLQRVEELDANGQQIIQSITKRLGLEEGQTWFATTDGTIKLTPAAGAQEPQS